MNEKELRNNEKTILIIDDEKIIRTSTCEMLMDLGYRVLLAEDGEQGVRMFMKHYDEINLVIMDVIMPRMGGVEAFDKIKAIDSRARIIVTSGYPSDERTEIFKEKGAAEVLKKPYLRNTLAELIEKHLD